jgi:hypothetical protein
MDKKMMYKTPRASVRGVFLCDGFMADVSRWPTIKGGTPEYYEFEDFSDADGSVWGVAIF